MTPNAERKRMGQERDNRVIVNALNSQVFREGETEDILREKIEEQKNEYEFTRMMEHFFPHLIPGVYELPMEILPTPRFRYTKDRCDPLEVNEALFHEMIRLSDEVNEQGWTFLDMKPGNVGLLNEKVVLLDTDPHSFYMFPYPDNALVKRRIRKYYRECCHMIILLVCHRYYSKEIPVKVLQDFIRSKKYTKESFDVLYDEVPPSARRVTDWNNSIYESLHYPVKVKESHIMEPSVFINHYGTYQNKHPLERIFEIIDHKS